MAMPPELQISPLRQTLNWAFRPLPFLEECRARVRVAVQPAVDLGVAAAVANAIYNEIGVRVREYPVTPDKLLAKMPDVKG